MDRNEMLKTSWKPYMIIHYEPGHGSELCHEMLLLGIEFDDEAVHLVTSEEYEHEEFYVNIKFIKIPKANKDTMKVITTKSPKVNDVLKYANQSGWSMRKNPLMKPVDNTPPATPDNTATP